MQHITNPPRNFSSFIPAEKTDKVQAKASASTPYEESFTYHDKKAGGKIAHFTLSYSGCNSDGSPSKVGYTETHNGAVVTLTTGGTEKKAATVHVSLNG
jgi:hypothetical protein